MEAWLAASCMIHVCSTGVQYEPSNGLQIFYKEVYKWLPHTSNLKSYHYKDVPYDLLLSSNINARVNAMYVIK